MNLGCHFSAGNLTKAQEILDAIPGLLEKKRVAGTKQLPTEVLVAKKRKHIMYFMLNTSLIPISGQLISTKQNKLDVEETPSNTSSRLRLVPPRN